MEIIVTIPEEQWDSESKRFAKKEFTDELLCDLKDLSEDIQIIEENIGMSSAWPVLLLILGNIALVGKEINEVIDNWVGLASKFKKTITKMRTKYGTTLISRDGAKLFALDFILSKEKIEIIEEIDGKSFEVYGVQGAEEYGLASKPFNLYILFFRVNEHKIYIFGIKSTSEIVFNYVLDTIDFYHF